MFKSARWRSEKNKIKAVFLLQFHVTQLTQLEGDALMISVIPADVGKPTTRLAKAKVRDESCYWEQPLHETVKFSQDPKTKKFHEKIYHFVVSKASSKFDGVGEVSIDFASYAEATKLCSLSLPLKNANSEAVLHVSLQRVEGSLDQRKVDRSENESFKDRSLRAHLGYGDLEVSVRSNPTDDHEASSGSNIMLSTSDSTSGLDTPREHKPKNTKPTYESSTTNERSSTDDSSIGEIFEEGSPKSVIQKLKVKVAVLTRQADVSELELQTLRKQIIKEQKKGRDLCRELATVKEECEKLKGYPNQTEEVKAEVNGINGVLLIDEGDPWALLDELRQELNHQKDLNANLWLQLQETLESKSKSPETDDEEEQRALEVIIREHNGTKEVYLLEQKIIDLYSEIELCKRDKDELETQIEQIALDYEILKQENHNLHYKLDLCRLQEQVKIQYECTSCTTVNELKTHVKNLEEELENQALGFVADLEDLMNAKTEQEQRAIRAEENVSKMRLQNAKAAERLQEELRRLSEKMAFTFEANEKAAMKAMDEANKLLVEKRFLEDALLKVEQDLRYIGDHCEEKLIMLSDRIIMKSKQLETMKKQIEYMIGEHDHRKRAGKSEIHSSGNLFLEKEKDLQFEIEEIERQLDVLVRKTENSQVSTAESSNPKMESDDAILPGMNKTKDRQDFPYSRRKWRR